MLEYLLNTCNVVKKRLKHSVFLWNLRNFEEKNPGDLCGSLCGEVVLWSFSTSLSLLSNIMLNLLTKSNFTFKLYCGLWISYVIMWLTLFTWILKNGWFKKKTTFVRKGKVEMISTFQRNRHLRKVSVSKTFTHVQEQKTRCHREIPLTFRLV